MPIIDLEKLRKQNNRSAVLLGGLLLIMATFLFFTRLGSYPLFNPDEALYAEPAREMLETHEYLTTPLNYQPRFTKPPLCIWMEALSYRAFGVNEFSARLFSATCAVILVMASFIFLLPYVGSWLAFLGACSLLSAPMFVAVGRMSITDMPLSLFISGSLFCLFAAQVTAQVAAKENHSGSKWLILLSYVLMGLAVMTKGPVGVVLPVVIISVYHLLRRNLKTVWKLYQPAVGAAIVTAIALPWYIAEIIATHGAYFSSFILRENFQRFTQVVDSHHGAWWYHLAAMGAGFCPWIIFIPQSLVRVFRTQLGRMRVPGAADERGTYDARNAYNAHDTHDAYDARNPRNDLLLFSALTVCIVLVFFSLSASKLLPYSLPAFPALACLLALELDYIFEFKAWRRLVAPIAILVVVLSGIGLAMPLLFSKLRHVPQLLLADANAFLAFQVFITFAALFLLLFPSTKKIAITSFILVQIAAFAYFGSITLSQLSQVWEAPIPTLSRMAAATGEPIFVYRIRKVSVPFYAGRATVLSPNQEFLTTTVEQELPKYPRACIIANVFDWKSFSGNSHFVVMKRLGDYMLIEWIRGN